MCVRGEWWWWWWWVFYFVSASLFVYTCSVIVGRGISAHACINKLSKLIGLFICFQASHRHGLSHARMQTLTVLVMVKVMVVVIMVVLVMVMVAVVLAIAIMMPKFVSNHQLTVSKYRRLSSSALAP